MRTTVIENVEARRLEDYEPDFHGLIDCMANLRVNVREITPGKLRLRFHFRHDYIRRDNGGKYGLVEGSAIATIRDRSIVPDHKAPLGYSLPENIDQLVEGAYAQEILLPISHIAAAMRLPIPLASPIEFSGMFATRPQPKQAALPE